MNTKEDFVDKTFGEHGLLASSIANYRQRPQQIELSKAIQTSIKEKVPLIAEAPTGVGKSLAALVPAFEHIRKTDEPVIVVTSSIVLQEQYMNKDIPMLEKILDFKVSPVLIKGRNNYLCVKKFKNDGKAGYSTSDLTHEHQEVSRWAASTKSGDKSELAIVPKHVVWSNFACVNDQECTGKQCSLYNVCHYYRERNKIASAKLIICNYHYFFTAIQNNVTSMLPPKAKIVIMDEGHEVSSIARDFQERKYSFNTLRSQFDQFAKELKEAEKSEVGATTFGFFDELELDQVNATLIDMFVGLNHEYKKVVTKHYTRDFWQIEVAERSRLQKYVTSHIERLERAVEVSERYLDKFGFSMETIMETAEIYGESAAEWMVFVHRFKEFLQHKATLLYYIFAYDEHQDDGDDIFWLQPYNESVSVHAKPTTAAKLTRPLFSPIDDGFRPIVMSATLSTDHSFDHLKREFGIETVKLNEIIVSSPFSLEDNLLWYLPADVPAGNDPEHINFTLAEMGKIIKEVEGRSLCLFTSKKNLREAESYFSAILPPHIRLISQETTPRQTIIELMKEHDHTVVLGTKSLFTGIDIQGHHLSAVLIDKIPFPMIGDPVNDYLMSQPRGFHKYSLPDAIISMKQAFGRLNRTVEDAGIVAVFDGRLATARYKKKIFNSFDFKVKATRNWDDVVMYIRQLF